MDQKHPNILIIMADQLTGKLFNSRGPADFLHAPTLKALAADSMVFSNCYTASPLCAPARSAFMTGQLPSRTGIYDNAAEFPAATPSFAHYLREAGYQTSLCGKMHFVGPDQLHGFEERLTTDIYPADFAWTPDYRAPEKRADWWYHNMGSVTDAGIAEISNQLEFDDEVAFCATQKIYDLARGKDERPWCLTVSFTHPHDPYVARKKYMQLYEDCAQLYPTILEMDADHQDAHSKRLLASYNHAAYNITDQHIKTARQAYFANISYLDEKIGEMMDALSATDQQPIIIFLSDHGDMIGERGLWYKMSFYEGSARIPLMIKHPDHAPSRIKCPVSQLDIMPTICDLAGIERDMNVSKIDGHSLLPVMNGETRTQPVLMEYAAEGSHAPLVSIRSGSYKYNHCALDPDQLFNLSSDPNELVNLADKPSEKAEMKKMKTLSNEIWDMDRFDQQVRESQANRKLVSSALRKGKYHAWDHQPIKDASNRFMRNHMDLNRLEHNQRYPQPASDKPASDKS